MAVHTRVEKVQIEAHLKNYQIGALVDFQGIVEGIDNSNFILKTTQGKFIFTIFESRIKKNELPFFINFTAHLAKNGIPCPAPILDNAGCALVPFAEKISVIVSFLSGSTLQPMADGYYNNIAPSHCFEVGKTLAKMHLATKDFSMLRKNDLSIDGFESLFSKFEGRLENYQKNLLEEISENLAFLKSCWRHDLPSLPAHLDLFPDNVFFDESGKISGVIDFYFAACDLAIYDFAIVVNAWCFDEKNNFLEKNFSELLRGYEEQKTFSIDEKKFLKIALVGAAMRFTLTRLHDMFFTPKDSLIKIKNPEEYLAKLRFFRGKL
jgi:homoserine kinase type II